MIAAQGHLGHVAYPRPEYQPREKVGTVLLEYRSAFQRCSSLLVNKFYVCIGDIPGVLFVAVCIHMDVGVILALNTGFFATKSWNNRG